MNRFGLTNRLEVVIWGRPVDFGPFGRWWVQAGEGGSRVVAIRQAQDGAMLCLDSRPRTIAPRRSRVHREQLTLIASTAHVG